MFQFFSTELQAYSVAANTAAAAYQAGDLQTAQDSRTMAEIGCATLERYLSDRRYTVTLSEQQQSEIATAVATLRAVLEGTGQSARVRRAGSARGA